jgi:hypothetical protein
MRRLLRLRRQLDSWTQELRLSRSQLNPSRRRQIFRILFLMCEVTIEKPTCTQPQFSGDHTLLETAERRNAAKEAYGKSTATILCNVRTLLKKTLAIVN